MVKYLETAPFNDEQVEAIDTAICLAIDIGRWLRYADRQGAATNALINAAEDRWSKEVGALHDLRDRMLADNKAAENNVC